MNSLAKLFPTDLYHSYIVEGDPSDTVDLLRVFLEGREDIGARNPDFFHHIYESFTIADAQTIKEWHSTRGLTEQKRVCIIGAKFINREAEQSLLKIIEEPQADTHFFLVVPRAAMLADTIQSRTHLIKVGGIGDSPSKKSEAFIKSTPRERIELVADLIKENKDNETSGELRYQATALINEIERTLYKKFKSNIKDEKIRFILRELENSRDYLSTPGASVKMILEHIALVL